jgi:hypothetical protein
VDMATIDQQRERLQQQLRDLEQREREEAAVRAIREEQAQARKAAVIAEHEQAEREHAADLTAMAKTLTDARKDLAAALDAAVKALTAAWDRSVAYGQLLDQAADELIAAGMPARWDEGNLAVRFDTGGNKPGGFGGPRLLLAGREWTPAHPTHVLGYAVELVKLGRVPGAQTPKMRPVSEILGDLVRQPKPVPAPQAQMPPAVVAADFNAPVSVNGEARYQSSARG